jgi:hypothetical protein
MNDQPRMGLRDQPSSSPPAISDEERLDWETSLEKPPVRPHGVIPVTLQYRGRSKPIPIAPPEEVA